MNLKVTRRLLLLFWMFVIFLSKPVAIARLVFSGFLIERWGFFFFSRHYNPWWVLACFTILFHNLLSLHFSLSSFSLSSLNPLLLGQAISVLVFLLVLMNMVPIQCVFLTVLVVSILITCAAQPNLCDFINLTIFFFLISVSNSSFVFILHVRKMRVIFVK